MLAQGHRSSRRLACKSPKAQLGVPCQPTFRELMGLQWLRTYLTVVSRRNQSITAAVENARPPLRHDDVSLSSVDDILMAEDGDSEATDAAMRAADAARRQSSVPGSDDLDGMMVALERAEEEYETQHPTSPTAGSPFSRGATRRPA